MYTLKFIQEKMADLNSWTPIVTGVFKEHASNFSHI